MRETLTVLTVVALLASAASADIIAWTCDDDGDGAIVMNDLLTSLAPNGSPGSYDLLLRGRQYGFPAHVEGDFTTDTELDPTVWIVETVDNFTTFDWTDYHIDIGMNKSFSIVGVISPPDWTWQIDPPDPNQPLPNGGTGWLGSVDYYAGTPIPVGGSGQFGLVVSFLGGVQFCTEQIPTPEPATVGVLAVGALLALRRRR